MSLILNGTTGLSDVDGTAAAPAICGTDTNTGIFFPAADTIAFAEGGAEAMRITSTGDVGIGTSSPTQELHLYRSSGATDFLIEQASSGNAYLHTKNTSREYAIGTRTDVLSFYDITADLERARIDSSGNVGIGTTATTYNYQTKNIALYDASSAGISIVGGAKILTLTAQSSGGIFVGSRSNDNLIFATNDTERARIDTSGNLFVGRTSDTDAAGITLAGDGLIRANRDGGIAIIANRNTNDGTIIDLRQAGFTEGTISVSGTTVSYNGGHLSRWSQLPDNSKDDAILKGTVLSNLEDMCVWTKDGEILPNEQLNKMKVSDVDGDTNVAGVFVNWTRDEDCNSDDMNVAMTGDMIIRIAQGVTVQRGDLLMSAGDGTAKPQGDDIVRSKTVAKVTSTHVTCTYADGSFCVPCVLMAC